MTEHAGGTRARAQMIAPCLRVLVRRARAGRSTPARPQTVSIGEHVVTLPPGAGRIDVDGVVVGQADVRHDPGSSSLEAWTSLDDAATAEIVAGALLAAARVVGAHRLAWSLMPGSVEQLAAYSAGLVREGNVTPPLHSSDIPHELWAAVLR